jgi:hypothetical protein
MEYIMSVNLTKEQINVINGFLDKMELKQFDLRTEVFDHMVTGAEAAMEKGASFHEVTDKLFKEWQPELNNHSNFWIGLMWSGPKILIGKAVYYTKKGTIRTLLIALPIILLIYVLAKFFYSNDAATFLNTALGLIQIAMYLLGIYFHIEIKKTKQQSTFSFLFKINVFGVGIWAFLYNPLLTDIMAFRVADSGILIPIIFHSLLLAFFYNFYHWYKLHMKSKNLVLA